MNEVNEVGTVVGFEVNHPMVTKIWDIKEKNPLEMPPLPENFPHEVFSWGSTKSAIILREMAKEIDKRIGRGTHSRIGKFLADVRQLLNAAGDWRDLELQMGKNPKRVKLPEKFVWDYADTKIARNFSYLPDEMRVLMRTVVKEIINKYKAELGLMPPKPVPYNGLDIMEWLNAPKTQMARRKFRIRVAQYYKPY